MLIAWENLADSALLTAGSELATLPGANVQQPHLSRKWHTVAGVNASYLTFDLRAALACTVLAVLGTNLTSAATVRVRASNADPTAVAGDLLDTGVLAGGVKAGYGAIYKTFNATARYWRIDLSDASLSDLEVGRVFLGPSWTPSDAQDYGWSVTSIDESKIVRSWGGQSYPDRRPQRRVLKFALNWLTKADAFTNAFALARAQGVVEDVLAIPDITDTYLSEQAVWGACSASEPLVHRAPLRYRQNFSIEERL